LERHVISFVICTLLNIRKLSSQKFKCKRRNRVWKGILRIRDLTKIWCGIWENAKYLDGTWDLTATREAGFAKIWARDAGLFCLCVKNSGNRHYPNKRSGSKSKSIRRAGHGILMKKERECRIRTLLPDPEESRGVTGGRGGTRFYQCDG